MCGHNGNPSLALLFLHSFACRVKPDLHGNDTSQCAHLCCHVPISSAVKRLFLRSALHLTPLATQSMGPFHTNKRASPLRAVAQYLHLKDRPSGAALFFSGHIVDGRGREGHCTSALVLVRHLRRHGSGARQNRCGLAAVDTLGADLSVEAGTVIQACRRVLAERARSCCKARSTTEPATESAMDTAQVRYRGRTRHQRRRNFATYDSSQPLFAIVSLLFCFLFVLAAMGSAMGSTSTCPRALFLVILLFTGVGGFNASRLALHNASCLGNDSLFILTPQTLHTLLRIRMLNFLRVPLSSRDA